MIEIHASQVTKWLSCPASAMHSEMNRKKRVKKPMPVGMLLGNQVHADITGHEYEEPKRVVYDSITSSETQAKTHRKNMKDAVEDFILENDMAIEQSEIPLEANIKIKDEMVKICGTVDMLVKTKSYIVGELAYLLVDLKTGANAPASSWTQLSVYSWLWFITGKTPFPSGMAVIWAKRNKTWDVNAAIRLLDEGMVETGKMSAFSAAKNAVLNSEIYNPTQSNCAWCDKEDCTMRFTLTSPLVH